MIQSKAAQELESGYNGSDCGTDEEEEEKKKGAVEHSRDGDPWARLACLRHEYTLPLLYLSWPTVGTRAPHHFNWPNSNTLQFELQLPFTTQRTAVEF